MEIKVKFIKLLEKKEGTDRNGNQWVSVLFLSETIEQYPRKIAFKVFNKQKYIDIVFGLNENDEIFVKFDVESREYQGKFYTDINVWDIILENESKTQQESTIAQQ